MRHDFRNSNPHGRLDSKSLLNFEKKLGCALPEPYRSFLLKHNGCECGSLKMPTTFFGIDDNPDSSSAHAASANPDFAAAAFFIIGEDATNTPWLIGLKGNHRGEIFRGADWESKVEPDSDDATDAKLVAPDFEALLDQLTAEAAIEDGDQEVLAAYLDETQDINQRIFGRGPLQIAIQEDQLDIVRSLLARGADASRIEEGAFANCTRRMRDLLKPYKSAA